MYLHGTGDDTVTVTNVPLAFNSTKYPGICKPSNTSTLATFKNLQSQLNRCAQVKGVAKIAVDGDIGPGTIGLMSKTLGTSSALRCTDVAVAADAFAAQAKLLADNQGAPATVSGPLTIAPSTLVSATGVETIAPSSGIAGSIADAFSGMSTVAKIAAVGIIGGIGYFLLGKGGKGKATTKRRY